MIVRAALVGIAAAGVVVAFNRVSFLIWTRAVERPRKQQALLTMLWLTLLAGVCFLLAVLMLRFWYHPGMSGAEFLAGMLSGGIVLLASWKLRLLRSVHKVRP